MKPSRLFYCIVFTCAVIVGQSAMLSAQLGGIGGSAIDPMRPPTLSDIPVEQLPKQPDYQYPSALDIPAGKQPQPQEDKAVAALEQFSLDFYKQLINDKTKQNENVVCSPWSVAILLTMLHDGTNGKTAEEIQKALRFQGDSKAFEKYLFMVAFNTRAEIFPGFDSRLTLETANSFWSQTDYPFHDSYKKLLHDRFLAELFTADFKGKPADAVKAINQWCANQTRDEIKEIVSAEDMNALRRMVILNALYFKAQWMDVFNVAATKPEPFHHADGSTSQTAMMNRILHSRYFEADGFRALQLRYLGNAHMLILLPDKADGLENLEKSLTPQMFQQIEGQGKGEMVNVKIPRFSFDNGEELIPALQKMGIESVFVSGRGDFSKMTDEQEFFVDFIRQRAVIRVDEKGTVAAAITGGAAMGGMPQKVYTFHANHPFLFLIRENTNNSILFLGRVHHPETVAEESL